MQSAAEPFADLRPLADALLYEGYLLYPYRASSLKNRQGFSFGGVYPRVYSQADRAADRDEVSSECLLRGASARLLVEVRFLELSEPAALDSERATSHALRLDVGPVAQLVGAAARHELTAGRLRASLELSAQALSPDTFRLSAVLRNESNSPARERTAALPDTLLGAHLLLGLRDGSFVSLLEPPEALGDAAQRCTQQGLWPVLAGPRGRADRLLMSPIILYDYPEIAAESEGDCCDATEIDEILLLRVLTLSDAEKRELRQGDPRGRAILERAERLSGDELLRLHGRLASEPRAEPAIRVGERVRLRPKARADIFDIALAGRDATVRAVERDFEDRVHLSVTVDDDPGADFGLAGLPGHRFFFFLDEVERLEGGSEP